MINSILKRFGYMLVKLSDVITARVEVAAFAAEIEAEIQAGEEFGWIEDIVEEGQSRFHLFEDLRDYSAHLTDLVYCADNEVVIPEEVRDQCSAVALAVLRISLKFGELLPRLVRQ